MKFLYIFSTKLSRLTICSAFKLLQNYFNLFRNHISISSKGNQISGICDYLCFLSRNSLYCSPQWINTVMVYDVQWRLSSNQVLLKLIHACLICEETSNFLNCHNFYLYPNHHIIKFYHFFGIPSIPRMFNPPPSAQYVSANIESDIVRCVATCPPLCTCYCYLKKVLKIIKTKQKKEKENNNDSNLGTEGKNCVVAQVTFYANKNNVFLSIEGSWGTLY